MSKPGKAVRRNGEQIYWSLMLVSFVAFMLLTNFFVFGLKRSDTKELLTLLLMCIILLFLFIFILQRVRFTEHRSSQQAEQIQQIESLYDAFRAERHDLINHVHTVYGLVSVNKMDEALNYLRSLTQEIRSLNQVLVSDNPALSALLQVKAALAARRSIDIELTLYDSLSAIAWTPTEMNTVIGNVLNNAMEAFDCDPPIPLPRRIWLMSERCDSRTVRLIIGNNGPVIPESLRSRIIEAGVSAKKGHSGIGLYSVRQILDRIGGEITLESDVDKGTRFTLILPFKLMD